MKNGARDVDMQRSSGFSKDTVNDNRAKKHRHATKYLDSKGAINLELRRQCATTFSIPLKMQ
jgi:hypothetical protein